MQDMIAFGAGYTPLVLPAIMALPPMKVWTPGGVQTWPREARRLEALAIPRLYGATVDRLGALARIFRHDLLGRRGSEVRLGARQQLGCRHDFVNEAEALGGIDGQV